MVLSHIQPNLSYEELKQVDSQDQEKEFTLYELDDMTIAIGSAKNQYANLGIIYYPIYLVTPTEKVIQVGVFEIASTKGWLNDALEELEISNFPEPLFYSFATPKYLKKYSKIKEHPNKEAKTKAEAKGNEKDGVGEEEEEGDGGGGEGEGEGRETNIPEKRREVFVLNLRKKVPKELKEETAKQAKSIREKYHESSTDLWIQKFLTNPYYQEIDNEGNGDCFFATIRDAFESIGQDTSVLKLRNKLAQQVDESTYLNYRELFQLYTQAIKKTTLETTQLKKQFDDLKTMLPNTLDKEERKRITLEAKKIKEKWDALKKENEVSKELLSDIRFMKNINSLQEFREFVRSNDFWADMWAIQTLERLLGIKMIIFSYENYQAGDYQNVLLCSNVIDPVFQTTGEFRPEYYLLVEYTGNHYKLLTYKQHAIFNFKELPFDLKQMIVDKCMERNSGVFSLIPDFQRFKQSLPMPIRVEEEMHGGEGLVEAKIMNLYDDSIQFCFYPKVTDKPLPGKGVGEIMLKDCAVSFSELAKIPQWRKKLDDFWTQTIPPLFTLNNHSWASVEHYYQASKYMKNHPEFSLLFALDSGTELSRNADMAFYAGGKSGKYKKELIRPKSVSIDPEFYLHERSKYLYEAIYAKFSQNPELKTLLLATKNAKLVLCQRRRSPQTLVELLRVRSQLMI